MLILKRIAFFGGISLTALLSGLLVYAALLTDDPHNDWEPKDRPGKFTYGGNMGLW
jgi:hypothetical protein